MHRTRRRTMRLAGAAVAVMATLPAIGVATATAGQGPPTHRKGHGWAVVQVCQPAGSGPYTYTIRVDPLSSLARDGKGYVAFANQTFKYYHFSKGKFRVKDAPAKPIEVGGLHYAKGHNGDTLSATVVVGPRCR